MASLSMKSPVRYLRPLKRFPGFRELAALRAEWQSHALYRRIGMPVLQKRLLDAIGPTIAAGPFAGMRYLDASSGSVLGAKLLGCYEAELHGVVREVCAMQPDVVVDVGAAEGYYAAGFARFPANAPRVVAFEASSSRAGGWRSLRG